MHKITFYQLSQHQPFPHLYLIGSTHQIFQKKREKTVQFPRMKCKFVALLPPLYCELKIVHFWLNFGTKALKWYKSGAVFFTMFMQHRIACTLFEKKFISNFSFFQKLVPLSLRRHLQTLRHQRSSAKPAQKKAGSKWLLRDFYKTQIGWRLQSYISEDISQSICQYQHGHCEHWRSFYNFLVISIIFILGWKKIARSRPESIWVYRGFKLDGRHSKYIYLGSIMAWSI